MYSVFYELCVKHQRTLVLLGLVRDKFLKVFQLLIGILEITEAQSCTECLRGISIRTSLS